MHNAIACIFALVYFNKLFQIDEMVEMYQPVSCYLVVFAVDDRSSLHEAEATLEYLSREELMRAAPVILVANKIDLVRNRVVTEEGKTDSLVTKQDCLLTLCWQTH